MTAYLSWLWWSKEDMENCKVGYCEPTLHLTGSEFAHRKLQLRTDFENCGNRRRVFPENCDAYLAVLVCKDANNDTMTTPLC